MAERIYQAEPSATRYRIGDGIILNTHSNSLLREETIIELEHRLVILLVYFIHHSGEVLQRDHLLRTIWQGKVVNDDSLAVAISHLRKSLGDNSRAPLYIKTIPGIGYQFIGKAEAIQEKTVDVIEPVSSSVKKNWPVIATTVVILIFGCAISFFYHAKQTKEAPARAVAGLAEWQQDYQQAHQLLMNPDEKSWRESVKIFRDVIYKYGDISEAYLGIADAKMKLLGEKIVIKENCTEVESFLHKSLALNPGVASAHRSFANLLFWCDRNYQDAEQHYHEAIRLDANDDTTLIFYAEFLLAEQRFDESLKQVEAARALNPLNYSVPTVIWIYQMQRRDDLALRELERILTTEPDNRYFHISAQRIFSRMGDEKKVFEQTLWLMKDAKFGDADLNKAEKLFRESGLIAVNAWLFERKVSADLGDYVPPLSWARYALLAKKYDDALYYLEAAYNQRQIPILWANVDPAYDAVRNTPRFQKILAQLKERDIKSN